MSELMHAGKNNKRAQEQVDDADTLGQQYLTFLIGKEVFAIGIADIREIIEYREPTTVPMMPSFIRGVLNLRG
ncbi:MAG: chemotaxis protein CheW, partial [Gammaproteobacteria bacterium]|nr:chemotaxis protein CheW [Gammaproteobacteria bacterium]